MLVPHFIPLVLVVSGLPLAAGIVPRNRFYGVRTRRTLADDAHWARINRIGGVLFSLIGALELIAVSVMPPDVTPLFGLWLMIPILVACLIVLALDISLYKGDGSHG